MKGMRLRMVKRIIFTNEPLENPYHVSPIYNNYSHPSEKPMDACDRIILASTSEGDNIFIPFAGSGNEMISAVKNNRLVMGCEIDEKYSIEIKEKLST